MKKIREYNSNFKGRGVVLGVHLHPEVMKRVKKYSYKKGWSKSKTINILIKRGLDFTLDEREIREWGTPKIDKSFQEMIN